MYDLGKEEISALESLFTTKKLFRYQGRGVETQTSIFEKEFSQRMGMNHSLFVTSGTNALILALEAFGIGEGDEVIVPCYTFVATINAVLHVKAKPVIAGVNENMTIDPDRLPGKITSRTKAIIAVHMDGLPCDMDRIMKIATLKKLILIEDVAQAVGGQYKGKPLGSFGDASCFSFNVDKIISCGEGGVVSFHDESYFKKALKLHDGPVIFGATFRDYLALEPSSASHSMRVSEVSSVIMRSQLKKLDPIINRLRDRKNIWRKSLPVIESSDSSGDCGTTIHLQLGDPSRAAAFSQTITKLGIVAIPLYARPAHCFWQWLPVMNLEEIDQKKLSFELAEDRIKLSSIVKMAVDYDLDIQKTIEQVELVKRNLR